MPPHCDTMDGSVVTDAKRALEAGDVKIILPWAPKSAEGEIEAAFRKTIAARMLGKEAKEVADLWFFETVVRLHRAGEGAPYTGLKSAGLDEGPVIPLAEEALETGSAEKLIAFLSKAIADETSEKLADAEKKKKSEKKSVDEAREYVEAMLGLQLWSHRLYTQIKGGKRHGPEEMGGHEH